MNLTARQIHRMIQKRAADLLKTREFRDREAALLAAVGFVELDMIAVNAERDERLKAERFLRERMAEHRAVLRTLKRQLLEARAA